MSAVLGLLPALAFAGVATGTIGSPSKLELTPTVRVSPHALSRTELSPVALRVTAGIANTDGSHPPALEELTLKLDRDLAIRTTGIPKCSRPRFDIEDWPSTKARCRDAAVGRGRVEVAISFGDKGVVPAESEMLVINGGTEGGSTTLFLLSHITVPVPATIPITVKIQPSAGGRYGSTATATIPKIAGGSGSITSLAMTIYKSYLFRGERLSVVSARCRHDSLRTQITARFRDDAVVKRTILRPCEAKRTGSDGR